MLLQDSKSQSVGFALQNFCRTVLQRFKSPKPRKTESLRSHAASKYPSVKSCFTEDFVSQPSFGEEKLKLFVNNLRTPQKFKFFDRHMSIKFDYPSQSRAPFAGERRFSKSRGLSASVSFVPLPPLLFFGSRLIFRTGKTPKIPVLCLSLLPNPTETLATQANYHRVLASAMMQHAKILLRFYLGFLRHIPRQTVSRGRVE